MDVPPAIISVMEDLYTVGLRLVRQYGQEFYESYGQRCWPRQDEVWSYGPLSGMQVHSEAIRSFDDLRDSDPRLVPIGAWTRAQFLVISVASRRFGHGPHHNGLPPPYGSMTLHLSWARPQPDGDPDDPVEAQADYARLRAEEPGF